MEIVSQQFRKSSKELTHLTIGVNPDKHTAFEFRQKIKIELVPFDVQIHSPTESVNRPLRSCIRSNNKPDFCTKELRFSSTVYIRSYLSNPYRENRGLKKLISNLKGSFPPLHEFKGDKHRNNKKKKTEQSYVPSRMSAFKRRLSNLKGIGSRRRAVTQ